MKSMHQTINGHGLSDADAGGAACGDENCGIAVWVLVLKEDLFSWPTWWRWRSKSSFQSSCRFRTSYMLGSRKNVSTSNNIFMILQDWCALCRCQYDYSDHYIAESQ